MNLRGFALSVLLSSLLMGHEIEPQATGSIVGRVVDPLGISLDGAKVELSQRDRKIRTAVSDRLGAFLLSDVPAGTYDLTVASSGYKLAKRLVSVSPGRREEAEIGLIVGRNGPSPMKYTLSGRITLTDTSRVSDVIVTIRNLFVSDPLLQTTASASGMFRVELSEVGQYLVYATRPGYRAQATVVTFAGLPLVQEKKVEFALERDASLR